MREHDLLADLAGRDVVLVAPHPDDEAIGPGGTVVLAARAGARVRVAVMARGDGGIGADGASAEQRRAESEACCRELGVDAVVFAGLSSAELRDEPAAGARALDELLGPASADVLLVPSPLERHPTHQASLLAALASGVARPGAAWWGYGAWDAIPALPGTVEVDTTAVRAVKTRAIAAHASQAGARPVVTGILSRDTAQAVFSRFTGDETRKTVERWMDLSTLAAAGAADPAAVGRATLGLLGKWVDGLWGASKG